MNPNDAHQAQPVQTNAVPASAGFPRHPVAAPQPQSGATPVSVDAMQPSTLQPDALPTDNEQWIAAAKSIIDSTTDDPYTQTEKLYELRTQFMDQVHKRSLKQKDNEA
ncbi:MAG: hypothetical protein WBP26_04490 [Candidatus Saccharimonadales bacterium]